MQSARTFAANTHAGRKYTHNEDSVGWDEAHGLYVLADGMGGHASGEVASRIVRDTLLENGNEGSLTDALRRAHDAVVSAAASAAELSGMGSTAVVARITDAHCDIAWVGDSRAYLLRRGQLGLVTRDHSYVELLLARGEISPAEAHHHPDRNLLIQSLGMAQPEPSQIQVRLRPGDRLLLCSDGLNDELTDEEIAMLLRDEAGPQRAASRLVEAALAKGGRDNVSVIVIDPAVSRIAWPLFAIPSASSVWLPVLIGWGAAILLFALWYGIIKS